MSKLVFISDIHGNRDFVSMIPDCDILSIAGDISPVDERHDYNTQKQWFIFKFIPQLVELRKKAKNIIFIAGNHDTYLFDTFKSGSNESIRSILPENVHYLCNESVIVEGIKFYGNPWCNAPTWARIGPPVWNFATHDDEQLMGLYRDIPKDVDIILTHGPAKNKCDQILDTVIYIEPDNIKNIEHLGCQALRLAINDIAYAEGSKLKYVISGHIHSASHDFEILKVKLEDDGVKFACVSILNEKYRLGDYKPLEINYESN